MIGSDMNEISEELIEEIKENEARYRSISQIALYANLEAIEHLGIFAQSTCDVECNVIFCYHSQKFIEDKKKQITYLVIRTLNEEIPKLKNKFSIAYVHSNLTNFLYFRNIVALLPVNFLAHLKEFYIVDGGLTVRLVQFLSWGEINTFIKVRSKNFARVEEIQRLNKATLGTGKKLANFQNKTSPSKLMGEQKEKIIRNKLYGKNIEQYPCSDSGIPIYIQQIIVRVYSVKHFLEAEGIMRKSCDVEQLEALEQKIIGDKDWKDYVRTYENPYVLVGLLKKILNNLNRPLFSQQIYDLILAFRSDGQHANDVTFFTTIVSKMSEFNRKILIYVLVFLKKGIIANVEHNKMPIYNVSVVFGPCLFRPKQYRLQDLMGSGKFCFAIKILLEQFQTIMGQDIVYKFYDLLEKQKAHYLKQ